MEPPIWSIKYRPTKWDEFVGQESAIRQLSDMARSRNCPHLIFIGPSGTGKTAAAEVFARELLAEDFEANYMWLNVRDLRYFPISKAKRSVSDLAKLSRDQRTSLDEYMSFVYKEAKATLRARGKTGDPNRSDLLHEAIRLFASTLTVAAERVKILVLDEADALDYNMQQALRRTMEIYGEICRFILITPTLANWIPAILSRCLMVRFPDIPQESIVRGVSKIAEREGVSIDERALEAIARECGGNMRRAIDLLQMASVAARGDTVTEDHVYEISEQPLQSQTRKAVSLAIEGSFVSARDIVRELLALHGYDPHVILRTMLEEILRLPLDNKSRTRIVDRIAVIDYRLTQAKNPFIHLAAVLASIGDIAGESKRQ